MILIRMLMWLSYKGINNMSSVQNGMDADKFAKVASK